MGREKIRKAPKIFENHERDKNKKYLSENDKKGALIKKKFGRDQKIKGADLGKKWTLSLKSTPPNQKLSQGCKKRTRKN